MAHCVAEFGGLDILVNNAATSPWFGPVVKADIGAVAKTWQTNQEGPLRYIQAAWGATMAEQGRRDPQHLVARRDQAHARDRRLQHLQGRRSST